MKDMFLEVLPNPVIIYDSQWKISKINESAIQLLGYSDADELIGRSIHTILPGSEHHVTDDLSRVLEKDKKAYTAKQIQHLSKDGKPVKIISRFRMLDAVESSEVYRYIESGFLIEEALQQHQQQLKQLGCWKILAENVPGLMMLLVNEDREIQCSVGGENKKRKKMPVIGDAKTLRDRLPQDFIKILHPLLEIAFDGTSVSREFNFGTLYYSVQLIPLLNHEYGNLCVIILQNITETKIVENKLKISKDAAEAANEAKSNFIAKMSHEIRTPLNAIIGFTEQLGKSRLTKKQSSYLDIVNNSSQHLLSLIDEILVLSRIEAGKVELDEEPFSMKSVIDSVYEVLGFRFKEKNLYFQLDCHPLINEVLLGDPARIRQILINLLGNALKFTRKGGVTLTCSVPKHTDRSLTLHFMISDTGIGIPAAETDRVFNPFHQVDNSFGRSYFGSGLGLTISKDLIEIMGGKIKVKSTPGKGSTFSFKFELSRSTEALPEPYAGLKDISGIRFDDIRILFVDDDPVSRLLGKVILDQLRARYVIASSGDEAIRKFKPGRFHVVLLDINMPGTTGIDVAHHIRKVESVKHAHKTKIIAMTANVLKRHIKKYFEAGMNDFLLKPFREKELYEKIAIHTVTKSEFEKPADNLDATPDEGYSLDQLLKTTKGDKEYTLLMLNTFLYNVVSQLDIIKTAFANNDYLAVAEAAHRLLPSVEHLGFYKTKALLEQIDTRYSNKSTHEQDPALILKTVEELTSTIVLIRKVREDFL